MSFILQKYFEQLFLCVSYAQVIIYNPSLFAAHIDPKQGSGGVSSYAPVGSSIRSTEPTQVSERASVLMRYYTAAGQEYGIDIIISYCLLELLAMPHLLASIGIIDAVISFCKQLLNRDLVLNTDIVMLTLFRTLGSQCTIKVVGTVNAAAIFAELLTQRSVSCNSVPIFWVGDKNPFPLNPKLDAVSDEILQNTLEYR
jgi:hypothetical protein